MLVYDDKDQVVLDPLSFVALVIQCTLVIKKNNNNKNKPLLNTDHIVELVNTYPHISHRVKEASLLFWSTMFNLISQIVLLVFSTKKHNDCMLAAHATILSQLALLLNPTFMLGITVNKPCIMSLTLVNIALETMQTATYNKV